MPTTDDITWFKQEFQKKIEAAIKDTVFSIDMITAVACQETGEVWPVLRKKQLSTDKILELCVGDTLDSSGGRGAFPKNRSDLLLKPNGQQMFDVARQALLDMAQYIDGYKKVAQNANKFCHGFGMFQFDLQFFLKEPAYFLEKQYADFNASLARCIGELTNALKRLQWDKKDSLTDFEMAAVAIAYNTGRFRPSLGLKQGYKSSDGKYYGEQFFEYIRMAHTVVVNTKNNVSVNAPSDGTVVIPAPTAVEGTGDIYEVDVVSDPLRLRSIPKADPANPKANVIVLLPDKHPVRAVTGKIINGFMEVETSLLGAHFRGFAAAKFLKRAPGVDKVPVDVPKPVVPSKGIVAVYMPRKEGTLTKRTAIANAFSLNEAGQPARAGSTPDQLRASIASVINWLAVDKPSNTRYQPAPGVTYCNIYAHDYCFLSGVYLPRVWWSGTAIRDLALGKIVEPLYGKTIDEQRANDLFRWLRDFGLDFGWRQTGNLTSLQTEVNQGAIGLIVARRVEDGRSGHIVAVVPETSNFSAKRNAAGEVTAPLQSQAGSVNFKYGNGGTNWWKGAQFAESAFWIHG